MSITISSAVRTNLLSMQGTAKMMGETQARLATGNKVNSALDNPSAFFTAQGLNNRASDLNSLMDGISNSVKTLEAADNGLSAITKTLESMQSTLRQARQDKSFEAKSFAVTVNGDGEFATGSTITFEGGATGVDIGGTAVSVTVADMTVDEAVAAINTAAEEGGSLDGAVRASNDGGKLRIENLSAAELKVAGTTSVTTANIKGNSVRAGLVDQYNDLRDQLDKLAGDATYNGVNLLRGDTLKTTFNETGSSSMEIKVKDGKAIDSAQLGITALETTGLDVDTDIDTNLDLVKSALGSIRAQSSAFGSNLSIVETREDFTKAMVSTLTSGASELTLADMNEEAANLLALQSRQALSQNSLSLASQADQSVLALIR
jgi:Flagellin and related hook-associated proteins